LSSKEKGSVKEKVLIGLLNTLQDQQGVLEHAFPEGAYIPSRRERDINTLMSYPQISSGQIVHLCAGTLQGVQRLRNLLGFRVNKSQEG
jgi:hypothetical protein